MLISLSGSKKNNYLANDQIYSQTFADWIKKYWLQQLKLF